METSNGEDPATFELPIPDEIRVEGSSADTKTTKALFKPFSVMPPSASNMGFKRCLSDTTNDRLSASDPWTPSNSNSDNKNLQPVSLEKRLERERKCTFCSNPAFVACYTCGQGGKVTPYCLNCNQTHHEGDSTVVGWGPGKGAHFRSRLSYKQGELMPDEDRHTEYKSVSKHAKGPRHLVGLKCVKLINGFLNGGGGCIYFGVDEEKKSRTEPLTHPVEHVVYTREARERIRKIVENKVSAFYPPITADLYEVVFVPVECNANCLQDHQEPAFLLAIHVRKGPQPLYVCRPPLPFTELCEAYERKDSSTARINIWDVMNRLGSMGVPPPLNNGFSDDIVRIVRNEGNEVIYRSALVQRLNKELGVINMNDEEERKYYALQMELKQMSHKARARLGKQQQIVTSAISTSGKVFLLLGKPGTGKTVFVADCIRRCLSWSKWKHRKMSSISAKFDAPRIFWSRDGADPPKRYRYSNRQAPPDVAAVDDNFDTDVQRKMNFDVLAYHFCQAGDSRTLNPGRFVRSIAALLVTSSLKKVRHYFHSKDVEETLSEERALKDPDFAFERGVLLPLRSMPPPRRGSPKVEVPYVIFVDGLDETQMSEFQKTGAGAGDRKTEDGRGGFLNNSYSIPELIHKAHVEGRIPSWVTIICTSRNVPRINLWSSSFTKVDMEKLDEDESSTLRTYVLSNLKDMFERDRKLSSDGSITSTLLLKGKDWTENSLNEAADVILARSQHNFLYTSMLLKAIASGQIRLDNVNKIPAGVHSLFYGYMRHTFNYSKMTFAEVRPLFEIMMAAYNPLTAKRLRAVYKHFKKAHQTVAHLLKVMHVSDLKDYQYVAKFNKPGKKAKSRKRSKSSAERAVLNVAYGFFHNSLSDWLMSSQADDFRCSKRRGHAVLAASDLRVIKFRILMASTNEDVFASPPNSRPRFQEAVRRLADLEEHLREWMGDAYLAAGPPVSEWIDNKKPELHVSPGQIHDVVRHLTDSKIGSMYQRVQLLKLFTSLPSTPLPGVLVGHLQTRLTITANSALNAATLQMSVIDATDPDNRSPMFLLCSSQQEERLDGLNMLLEAKADPSIKVTNGLSCLSMATRRGFRNSCQLLLNTGALDVNHLSVKGHAALHTAARRGYSDIARLLVFHKADVNLPSRNHMTSLGIASEENHLDIVRTLLRAGADQELVTTDGKSPLWLAASRGHARIVEELLNQEKRVSLFMLNVCSWQGVSPLATAAANGSLDVIRTLLKKGASPWTISSSCQSVLWQASSKGRLDAVRGILEHVVTHRYFDNQEIFTPAAKCTQLANAAALVDWRPLRKAKLGHTYMTPAFRAVIGDQNDVLQLLIQLSIELHFELQVNGAESQIGRTLLMDTAYMGREAIAQTLLTAHKEGQIHLDLDCVEADGGTAVSDACFQGHSTIVAGLIDAGASLDIVDENHISPLMYATSRGCIDVLHLLHKHMEADINCGPFSTLDVLLVVIASVQNAQKDSGSFKIRLPADLTDNMRLIVRKICVRAQMNYFGRQVYLNRLEECKYLTEEWYAGPVAIPVSDADTAVVQAVESKSVQEPCYQVRTIPGRKGHPSIRNQAPNPLFFSQGPFPVQPSATNHE